MSNSLQVVLKQDEPVCLDVDLQCRPGELLALVGPSGSGKSTVLRSIAGLHQSRYARIVSAEHCWEDSERDIRLKPQGRRVGMVFQNYALFPHKSALENVMLAMQHRPARQREAMARDWLARTNMTGLEQRKPDQLSGGQRQRVALARALARDPQVLLLDEPFSAVDQQTRRKLYRELARLRLDLPVPILMVTHDINEVQQLADSVCLIHRGRTLQYGQTQQVINRPDSKQSARLLGHQNLVPAHITRHHDSYTEFALENGVQLFGPRSDLPEQTSVYLLIPPTTISIIENGARHPVRNCLHGTISDAVAMGDELSVRLRLDVVSKALRFRLAQHQARQLRIGAGSELDISIRADDIHVIRS